jgi:predicted Fe-Mo cluster-binding NifX family protein
MKIAFPAQDGQIDAHFGHCEHFVVMTIENNRIVEKERLDPPPGCGCKSNVVPILANMGVSVMLAGNMGQGAVNVLNSHGIQVVRGCAGEIESAAQQWLAGQISDSGKGCSEHGNCPEH